MDITELKKELLQFAKWKSNRVDDGKTLIQQINIYVDEVVLPQANAIKSDTTNIKTKDYGKKA